MIPKDIENIIYDYKNEFEKYKKKLIEVEELLYNNDKKWIKTDLDYLDFKEYFLKKNIYKARFQIKNLYGINHPNNNRFWNLNMKQKKDDILKEYRIKYIIYSHMNQIFYLKFE